jgi:hypothetical protein
VAAKLGPVVPIVGRHPSLASLLPERGLPRSEPGLGDRSGIWEAQLDRLAERVFGGEEGARRAAPLLARWDAAVGRTTAGDADHAALQAARVDWALCDAELDAPGETWAWRAAHGSASCSGPPTPTSASRSA